MTEEFFVYFGRFCAVLIGIALIIHAVKIYHESVILAYYKGVIEELRDACERIDEFYPDGGQISTGGVKLILFRLSQRRYPNIREIKNNDDFDREMANNND